MSALGMFRVTKASETHLGRQAIPMVWSFAETNPFSHSTGNWTAMQEWVRKTVLMMPAYPRAFADQDDAIQQEVSRNKVVSTDPPYYDNIGYADLSDFFYVWLRKSLRHLYPELFNTLAVPKAEELIASRYRHATKAMANRFFLNGMSKAMSASWSPNHTPNSQ